MVSVATGMANCYENGSMRQATKLPRTEVRGLQIQQTGGFSPRDTHARGKAYRLPQDAAILIPSCGLRKATAIPEKDDEGSGGGVHTAAVHHAPPNQIPLCRSE